MNYPAIDSEANDIFGAPNPTGTPERRLLLAVLERALLDYVGNDSKECEQSQDWIFEETAPGQANDFSFPWICQQLDLDVDDIRSKIKEMPRRGASRIAPWYVTKGYNSGSNSQAKNLKKSGKVLKFLNKKERVSVC